MPFKDPEARRRYLAKWRAGNRESTRKASREFRERHLERTREEARLRAQSDYHSKDKHDPAYVAANRVKASKWYRGNSEKAKRRILSYRHNALIVKEQQPKWANRFFISEIYDLAKRRTDLLGVPRSVNRAKGSTLTMET